MSFSAPRKSLGQNFLQDPNIISKIVASLNIQQNDTVIEIGPGRGALTELMLPLTGHLHVVEYDDDLANYWQERSTILPHLTVHARDILKFDLNELSATTDQSVKVIGNLPYNISSPILFHLMKYADLISVQIVMLQKEVVERMVSAPGSKQYGRLSVMLQQRYDIEYLFSVPSGAFFPPPKVESAIARLAPLADVRYPVIDQNDFVTVVKQAFSQRRKTLKNTLKGLLNIEQITMLDIDPSARAETLSVEDFVRLANAVTQQP